MAVSDQSAAALNGAAVSVALNASTGKGVLIPKFTRLIEASCSAAFRCALEDLDGDTVDETNSHIYAADMVHAIWAPGVKPGGDAPSTFTPAEMVVTFRASSGTPDITLTFRT